MSDPLRTQSTAGSGAQSPVDPAAQIERLLLSGLDLYFSGQYQDAINVWTRVVFLERGHSRARAYIERARTAIAEQQRETDELVHRGRLAYDGGDVDGARRLLTRAIERGGSADDAVALLQQLNRFGPPAQTPVVGPDAPAVTAGTSKRPERAARWVPVAVAVAVLSAIALFAAPLVSWFGVAPVATTTSAPAIADQPLPVIRTGEMALDSARRLYVGGHLADALRTLDGIDIGDPVRARADQLRGDIQRDLLAMVRQSSTSPQDGGLRR
jgi:hypothetical protein